MKGRTRRAMPIAYLLKTIVLVVCWISYFNESAAIQLRARTSNAPPRPELPTGANDSFNAGATRITSFGEA
jgi:hypothetical protein